MTARVAVVGGGIAGVAAALELRRLGCEVVVFERRARLGGLARSFERGGLRFDNGQHVFLRCCEAYRDHLREIGAEDLVVLQPALDLPVIAPGGRAARITRSAMPSPWHLASSLARYCHLTLGDRLRAARLLSTLGRLDPEDPRLDEQELGSWLDERGAPRAIEDRLLEVVLRPTLNLEPRRASLALATFVVRVGLLGRPDAADLGWSTVPLGVLHHERAAATLDAASVEVRLATSVNGLERLADGTVVLRCHCQRDRGDAERFDAVLLAVPHHAAHALAPWAVDERVARLGHSPIVNAHLVLDRKVIDEPVAAAVGSPVEFVFDRTEACGLATGQCLVVSLSAAQRALATDPRTLVAELLDGLAALFPSATHARLLDAHVTKEPRATFLALPGSGKVRPRPGGVGHGVFVAGSWTATGWPATTESAVRSARAAARELVASLGIPRAANDDAHRTRVLARIGATSAADIARNPHDRADDNRATPTPTIFKRALPSRANHDAAAPAGSSSPAEAWPDPDTVLEGDATDARAVLERARAVVEPRLRALATRLVPPLAEVLGYQLAGEGKRLRAALVLVSARAAGASAAVALEGAIALELVHEFSLVHDDLVDGDATRRHRPTLWASFGADRALIAGDALAVLAIDTLLGSRSEQRTPAVGRLVQATASMIEGQALDMALEHDERVSVAKCLDMQRRKTAALLACAASMGALLAGAPSNLVDALERFGNHLGLAFQARDDLLGIWGDEATTGKPVGSDLASGKRTLPVLLALEASRGIGAAADTPQATGAPHAPGGRCATAPPHTMVAPECSPDGKALAIVDRAVDRAERCRAAWPHAAQYDGRVGSSTHGAFGAQTARDPASWCETPTLSASDRHAAPIALARVPPVDSLADPASLRVDDPQAKALAARLELATSGDPRCVAEAADALRAAGADRCTELLARHELALALEALDSVAMADNAKRALAALARFVVDRER